ncbi:chaperone protein dnaJ C76, chloroplastic-like [Tripterygium wilfordii]|uniref:chaperone protein dnaJ C76, chloroplastic-like n=1 Tax=Tripterygium wilfordii TaxID=458696 RepID=UPI0018F7FB2F|nr:chaperone protein dnaJ C76, chloroplastic-like [Tripterygium wilfordii]
MLVSTIPTNPFSGFPVQNNNFSRQKKCVVIRSCARKAKEITTKKKSYYELLGVSVDSNSQKIKEAYRKLQKKHHPDIAGQQGHEYTLMLNEAYKVLMREDSRRDYDASIGQFRANFENGTSSMGYSSWRGVLRPQALFVDENACIGCRECVHHAANTFVMDEVLGCARVRVQYGDDDKNLEVAVDSCPVNCIFRVESEELPVLELLIQPQYKEGYGVFGGGWERPANVFKAAESFKKQQKRQQHTDRHYQRNAWTAVDKETPAQAEARANATVRMKMEIFSRIWDLLIKAFGSGIWDAKQ